MPQQLFIPSLGSLIVLAEPWTFSLFFESRNKTMLQALCPNKRPETDEWKDKKKWRWRDWGEDAEHHEGSELLRYLDPMDEKELSDAESSFRATRRNRQPYLEVTLPAGQQLAFARIYIRQGGTAFNSVTFRTTKSGPDKLFHSKRFWVKLQDANKIVCNILG